MTDIKGQIFGFWTVNYTLRKEYQTNQGKTLCANDWCKIYGIPNNVLIHRYRSGLPLEQVFSKTSNRGKSFNNK